MTYRGLQRNQQAARVRRLEAEAARRDETADPASLTSNELAATIYRLQGRTNTRAARLTGKINETLQARLATLVAESVRRRCAHEHIIGAGHDQTMTCDDCGYVFPEVL
jgi:hypothetical protein